jgi:hypothetical protein
MYAVDTPAQNGRATYASLEAELGACTSGQT